MKTNTPAALSIPVTVVPPLAVASEKKPKPKDEKLDWVTSTPFIFLHAVALIGIFFFPVTWKGIALAVGMYYLRMFGITAGYHRYFAHRSYKTSRPMQFIMAVLGTLSLQKGVLWWAAHHRNHHRYSDTDQDVHSPIKRSFWWAQVGWILCSKYDRSEHDLIKDFAKYPELRWLDKHFLIPPFVLLGILFAVGGASAAYWGFAVSTVCLWHGTFLVNTAAHLWGSRRFETTDQSRNNWWVALLTMGEGWHNNHHHYMSSANQGFYWWEIDFSYYILKAFSLVGLVWDLRKPPERFMKNAA